MVTLTVWLLAICAVALLHRLHRYMFERPDNFPPGLPRLPLFGSYLFLLLINFRHMHRAAESVARWYGTSMLGFWYGSMLMVSVHDMATSREVLNNPDLDGRPLMEIVRARDPEFKPWGVFFRDGPFWKRQRRFALRHLRDYGFGRRFDELEAVIGEQLGDFVEMLREGPQHEHERRLFGGDGIVELPHVFSAQPANVFLKCVTNEAMARDQLGVLYRAGRATFRFQRSGCMYGRMFSLIKCSRWLAPAASGYREVRDSAMELHGIVAELVAQHWRTYEAEHERSFLDVYFRTMENERDVEDTSFHLTQLTHTIVDFIFPPLSAIATGLSYLLLRLLQNPICMKMVRQQLDDVVGRGRMATLDDRPELAYLEAALRESSRLDTLVPTNVPHRAIRATKVGGFDIPENCLVAVVLQSAHTDAKAFGADAMAFRPERFLNEAGKLDVALDKSLPFGAGKRLCAGETFARNMLFLFAAAVLQNFVLSVPDGETLPNPMLEQQTTGVIKSMPDFRLKFTSR